MNLGGQIKAKSFHYGKRGFQGWVSVLAKGTVKLFAGKSSKSGNLRHTLSAGDDAKCVSYVTNEALPQTNES